MSDTCPKHHACLPATCSQDKLLAAIKKERDMLSESLITHIKMIEQSERGRADAFRDAFAKAFPCQSEIQATHYPDCCKDSPPCAFTLGWNLAMDYIDSAGHEITE